jgi:hypothetical protein
MSEQYTNRRDETYYLLQGRTKTGKPKYYCSKKPAGETVESMPEGFEWYEHPDTAIVSVRKTRPSRILPCERELLDEAIQTLAKLTYFLTEQNVDDLTVYLPDRDPDEAARIMEMLSPYTSRQSEAHREYLVKSSRYSPMMRFVLVDADERLFLTQRWCFRGRIDNWITLSPPLPLSELLQTFVPHLGQESFFDLI